MYPGDASNALPGLIAVPFATYPEAPLVLAADVGFGFYNRAAGQSGGSKTAFGGFAAAFTPTPLPFLSVVAELDGGLGFSPDDDGTSANGTPTLSIVGRHRFAEQLYIAPDLGLILGGGEAGRVEASAWSPYFGATVSWAAGPSTWLTGRVGYLFDNSANGLESSSLSVGERVTFGASSFNQLQFGLGASHRIKRVELLGEFSLGALVGENSPAFSNSPMNFAAGARYHITESVALAGQVELSPSAMPESFSGPLIPIRPRFAMGVGVRWRFGGEEAKPGIAPPEAVEEKKEVVEEPPAASVGVVNGRIVDEGGRPIPDVKVVLIQEGQEPLEYYSDAEGRYTFAEVPHGPATVTTETAGFDPVSTEVTVGSEPAVVPESVLYESVPGGQVRGKVLDLRGEVVRARIIISPGDQEIKVGPDGSFSVDLAPGSYRVKFVHEGHRTQMRHIRVQDRGVVVVNIALEK